MKNTYHRPKLSSEEEKNLLLNATIVFDTNILLNFYKYSANTYKDACDVVETVKDRLFLPYQVGLEYYNKRKKIIKGQNELAKNIKKEIDNFFNVSLNLLEQSDFHSIIQEHRKKIKEEIDEKNKIKPKFSPDHIQEFWERVYKDKVSVAPSVSKKIELCNTINKRYELEIPPGFKDDNKKHNLYGDALIWLDILEYAKTNNQDIIFVSDDTKQDWVKDGDLRMELIKEFQYETNKKIKHYTFETFIKKITKEQRITLQETTQAELKNLAEVFKNIQNFSQFNKMNDIVKSIQNNYRDILQNSAFKNDAIINACNQYNKFIKKINYDPIQISKMYQANALIDYVNHLNRTKIK